MNRVFPTATKTFTVSRKSAPIQVGSNIVPVSTMTVAASGLSVALKDQIDTLATKDGGIVLVGNYLGATFADAPIFVNDTLTDEAEVDANGRPVRYTVQGVTKYLVYLRLHMKRADIGV